ncbi:hypothetical protein RFI_23023, partial [Reticulomyxa filosa]
PVIESIEPTEPKREQEQELNTKQQDQIPQLNKDMEVETSFWESCIQHVDKLSPTETSEKHEANKDNEIPQPQIENVFDKNQDFVENDPSTSQQSESLFAPDVQTNSELPVQDDTTQVLIVFVYLQRKADK